MVDARIPSVIPAPKPQSAVKKVVLYLKTLFSRKVNAPKAI